MLTKFVLTEKTSKTEENHVYIAFNKPVGIVCTTDTKREKTIL